MKLRWRFTFALALAALVPIAVAAVVTRETIASNARAEYEARRKSADEQMQLELRRLTGQLDGAVAALADEKLAFSGAILRELLKQSRDAQYLLQLGRLAMRGFLLDLLTVTGSEGRSDVVLISETRARLGETDTEVRQRAIATNGEPYFSLEKIQDGHTVESVLAVVAARVSRESALATRSLVIKAGKRVTEQDLLAAVRVTDRVDARVVTADGKVRIAGKQWDKIAARGQPIRAPLLGFDKAPIAYVEVAVSDGNLEQVLRELTFTSAGLAVAALAVVILLGLVVARRTARDLDQLVAGAQAAARGDLEHRVPVRNNDEVGAVASAFNLMMEDLQTSKERLVIAERIAAWQEIARRLAHEIKNPLTPIQMAMDNLRKTWKKQHPSFEEILEESTSTVLQEADRLKHIVAEFSDFARMPKPDFQRVDLNEIVRSSLTLYQGTVPIDIQLGKDVPEIDGDKGQLNQVVLNLVENARDAIGQRADGRIGVSTRLGDAGDRILLVVEDNGAGVPQELKDKVFAPYFTTKHAKGGTGLGLAIVHRIVSDHGGRIAIGDAPSRGARFAIELPLRNGTTLLASRI